MLRASSLVRVASFSFDDSLEWSTDVNSRMCVLESKNEENLDALKRLKDAKVHEWNQ